MACWGYGRMDTRRTKWKKMGGHQGNAHFMSSSLRKWAKQYSHKIERQYWNRYAQKYLSNGEEPFYMNHAQLENSHNSIDWKYGW